MITGKTILSCIQPTGDMHLGNYFGAVQNWVNLQADYTCFYGVVDYHAITMPFDIKKLRNNTWELISNLVAVGVSPDNIFIQSLVPEHAELGWIFNCFCPYGELTRMTQFKDKSHQAKDSDKETFISAGLLTYPILQAADILIYKADFVPVGQDQQQHLELTRNIAQRFNYIAKKEYFMLPEALFTPTPKIQSLADPTKKMSKSAGEKHYINVFADESQIRKQVKSAVTDIGKHSESMSPGVSNLFEIIKACGNSSKELTSLQSAFRDGSLKYVDLKEVAADAIISLVTPFREKKQEINQNKRELKEQIKESSERIRKTAQQTLYEVKELVGLMNVRYK